MSIKLANMSLTTKQEQNERKAVRLSFNNKKRKLTQQKAILKDRLVELDANTSIYPTVDSTLGGQPPMLSCELNIQAMLSEFYLDTSGFGDV